MPYLSMGGEDFAYYLQKVPGCFFFVGSAPNEKELFETPHHSKKSLYFQQLMSRYF